ncbi:phage holin [Metabacillus sp. 84]|uniref:phage holin n=1 Tax=Metabacillus sp. 84 TaxID=3404705 RepID=UPI003CF6C617
MKQDIFTLLSGFLTALLLFLASVGIAFEWLNQESINAFVVLLGAAVALIINARAVWKNTYVSKEAQDQKRVLERNNLL